MRKKLAAWLLIWTLCLNGLSVGLAQETIDVRALLTLGERILYAAPDGIYEEGQEGLQPLVTLPDETLFAADADEDTLYLCTNENRNTLRACDATGQAKAEYSLPIEGETLDFAVSGAVTAIVYEETKTQEARLAVWNRETNQVERYDVLVQPQRVDMQGEWAMVACMDEYGLYPVLALIHLTDGEITLAAENVLPVELCLDMENNRCYAMSQGELLEVTWDQKTSRVRRLATGMSAFCLMSGEVYACAADATCAEPLSAGTDAGEALTIAGFGTELMLEDVYLKQNMALFKEKTGVDARLQFYSTADDLILALMSGLDPIDLLLLTNFNLANYERAGILANLDELPAIQEMQSSGRYAPWLFELGRTQDGLFTLPVSDVSPSLWEVDASLLAEMGEEMPPADWTWGDFLALAERCAEHGFSVMQDSRTAERVFAPGVSEYITLYVDPIAQTAEFDTPGFREMCETWKKCIQSGYAAAPETNKKQLFSETQPNVALRSQEEYARLLTLPRCGDKQGIEAEAIVMGVSSGSARGDLAAELLAGMFSDEVQAPADNGNAYVITLPPALVFADYDWYAAHYPDALTREQYDQYQQITAQAVLRDRLISVRHTVNECLTGYFLDQATLDEAVRQIDQRVGMILFE